MNINQNKSMKNDKHASNGRRNPKEKRNYGIKVNYIDSKTDPERQHQLLPQKLIIKQKSLVNIPNHNPNKSPCHIKYNHNKSYCEDTNNNQDFYEKFYSSLKEDHNSMLLNQNKKNNISKRNSSASSHSSTGACGNICMKSLNNEGKDFKNIPKINISCFKNPTEETQTKQNPGVINSKKNRSSSNHLTPNYNFKKRVSINKVKKISGKGLLNVSGNDLMMENNSCSNNKVKESFALSKNSLNEDNVSRKDNNENKNDVKKKNSKGGLYHKSQTVNVGVNNNNNNNNKNNQHIEKDTIVKQSNNNVPVKKSMKKLWLCCIPISYKDNSCV